jgi:hypothetical protein
MKEHNITNATLPTIRVIRFMQGKEPADVVHQFHLPLRRTGFTFALRDRFIRQACEDRRFRDSKRWSCTRLVPALVNAPFRAPSNWGGAYLGKLTILEGEEPADVIYAFAQAKGVPPALRSQIIGGACSWNTPSMFHPDTNASYCNRQWPMLFNQSISLAGVGDDDGEQAGTVGPILLYGSEYRQPSDQIDSFTRQEGISHEMRDRIIATLCGLPSIGPDCGRTVVSHFSVNVGDTVVEFLEGHEAADILYRAFRKKGKPQYQREQVFDIACQQPLVQCSRRRAILWSNEIQVSEWDEDEPDKAPEVDRLVIWDDAAEVADAVWAFGEKHGWDYGQRLKLTLRICQSPEVGRQCSRTLGSMAWIPVNRDDNFTCPREPFERPLDGTDLVKWFFDNEDDGWRKTLQECKKSNTFKKSFRTWLGYASFGKYAEIPNKVWEKWWDEELKNYACPPDWLTKPPNRTALLPEPYNNVSFPVPWLVVRFEVHIGFPVLILYGFIPLLTSWILLSLHGCKDTLNMEERRGRYGCCVGAVDGFKSAVAIGRACRQWGARGGSGGSDGGDVDDGGSGGDLGRGSGRGRGGPRKRDSATRRKKKAGEPKTRREEYSNGRMRAKTPVRAVAAGRNAGGDNDNDGGGNSSLKYARPVARRCCRCCCCWSCDGLRCCFRRCWCPARCVARCDSLYIVPRWRPSLVIGTLFALHVLLVYTIFIDVLNGFFIVDPYKEAGNYFEETDGNYMGRVEVLENETPIEALYEFASVFGTAGTKYKNTAILRTPRFWSLLDQLCEGNEHLDCSRRTPREQMLDDIAVTQFGFKQEVHYHRPDNPESCAPVQLDELNTTSCVMDAARAFCDGQLDPGAVPNCYDYIAGAIVAGLKRYEDTLRWDGKNHYRALALTRDVYNGTIMKVATKLTREMAVPCFKGPTDFTDQKKMWQRIGRISQAVKMTQDPDEREFYDQPCRVVFGSMCARTKKSGDMMIEQMN